MARSYNWVAFDLNLYSHLPPNAQDDLRMLKFSQAAAASDEQTTSQNGESSSSDAPPVPYAEVNAMQDVPSIPDGSNPEGRPKGPSPSPILPKLVHFTQPSLAEVWCSLQVCIVSGTGITDISPLKGCFRLVKLDAHDNKIRSLPDFPFWAGFPQLYVVYLHQNLIEGQDQVARMSSAPKLGILTIFDNPLTASADYDFHRRGVIDALCHLQALDHHLIADGEAVRDTNLCCVPAWSRFAPSSVALAIDLYLKPEDHILKELENIAGIFDTISRAMAHLSPVLILQKGFREWNAQKELLQIPEVIQPVEERPCTVPTIHHPVKRSPNDIFFPPLSNSDTLTGPKARDMAHTLQRNYHRQLRVDDWVEQQQQQQQQQQQSTSLGRPLEVRKQLEAIGGPEMVPNSSALVSNMRYYRQQGGDSNVGNERALSGKGEAVGHAREWEQEQNDEECPSKKATLDLQMRLDYKSHRKARFILQDIRAMRAQQEQEASRTKVRGFREETARTDESRRFRRTCMMMPVQGLIRNNVHKKLTAATTAGSTAPASGRQPPRVSAAGCTGGIMAQRHQAEVQEFKEASVLKIAEERAKRTAEHAQRLKAIAATRSNTSCAARIKTVNSKREENFHGQMMSIIRAMEGSYMDRYREETIRKQEGICRERLKRNAEVRAQMAEKRELEEWKAAQRAVNAKREVKDFLAARVQREGKAARARVSQLREVARRPKRKLLIPTATASAADFLDARDSTTSVDLISGVGRFPARGVQPGNSRYRPQVKPQYCGCPPDSRSVKRLS